MTKEEKIKLLTDNNKTDDEIALTLNLSKSYLKVLRNRWNISKKRGVKPGILNQNTVFICCKTCGKEIKKRLSETNKKYCSKRCVFQSAEYRKKLSSSNRDYMQTAEYRKAKSKPDTPKYKKYHNRVQVLTRKTYNLYKEQINPENLPRKKAGQEGGYHLDHKIPVRYGFDNNISPEDISNKDNLQMLPWKDNVKKGKKLVNIQND
jgi:hypothetical protein